MNSINIPRPIAHNVLLSKYDAIDYLPLVDSKELTNYQMNFANTCRQLPVGYDFIANTINKMHALSKQGKLKIGSVIKDVADDYYRLTISRQTVDEYLKHADGRTIRQDIGRQLQRDLFYPFVKLIKPNGGFVKRFPFIFEKEDIDSGNIGILLLKELFEPFITGEYNKKESDGFITVPTNYYSKLSLEPENRAKEHNGKIITLNNNALYKMNIYLLLRHNNKTYSLDVPTQDFFCNVIPELTKKDRETKKLLLNYSPEFAHGLIMKALRESNVKNGLSKYNPQANHKNKKIIRNLYFEHDSVTIFLDLFREAKKHVKTKG